MGPRVKSSCQGASTGVVTQAPFFGKLYLNRPKNDATSLVTALLDAPRQSRGSQVLLRCLSLAANPFLGSQAAVF